MSRDALRWIDDELKRLDAETLLRRLVVRESPQQATIRLDGRDLVNFGSNDYLGLAADPRLFKAAAESLAAEGFGGGASPLVTGRSASHARLEHELARFEDTEAALLFPSGFAANAGTIAAIAGRGDLILSDERNHASIIDGCRLSRAEVFVYPHGDVQAVAGALTGAEKYRRRLIVTDSLFSMDGDAAPLADLAELADRHDAMLMVDEAHGTGVFGASGRGVCEQVGVEDRVDIRVGTLSKALGAMGGFVAGSRRLIDYLLNRARSYVFSTAAPPAIAAAALAALQIVREEPHRRTELLRRSESLRSELASQGFDTGGAIGQIIPVIVGRAETAMGLSSRLRQRGYFVPGIRPPTVPPGRSLLRISLSYAHSDETIEALVGEMLEVRH